MPKTEISEWNLNYNNYNDYNDYNNYNNYNNYNDYNNYNHHSTLVSHNRKQSPDSDKKKQKKQNNIRPQGDPLTSKVVRVTCQSHKILISADQTLRRS